MKLNNKQTRILKTLACVDFILAIIFIISVLPFKKKKGEPSTNSALLNVNKIEEIEEITLKKGGLQVTLNKVGSFWIGTDSGTNKTWPADNQNVANFISKFSQIVPIYTASSSKRTWESFGLGEEQALEVNFYNGAGTSISEITFGDTDSLTARIAFRIGTKENVYRMDSSIESYLNLSTSFWADPFVYPQALTGYSRMQSESILRHGAISSFSQPTKPADYIFRKDFENGASAKFYIYKSETENENLYDIVPKFVPGQASFGNEKKVIENFDYTFTMSQWTLEKFSEEVIQQ